MNIDLRGVRKFYLISFALVFVISAASFWLYFSDFEPLINGYEEVIKYTVMFVSFYIFGSSYGSLEKTFKEIVDIEVDKKIRVYAKLLFSNQIVFILMFSIFFIVYILTHKLSAITMIFLQNILFLLVFYPSDKRTSKKLGINRDEIKNSLEKFV